MSLAHHTERMTQLTLAQEEERRSFLADAQLMASPKEFLQVTATAWCCLGHTQPEPTGCSVPVTLCRTCQVQGQLLASSMSPQCLEPRPSATVALATRLLHIFWKGEHQ